MKPKLLVEQEGALITSGFKVSLKGDQREVTVMVAYAMNQVPEMAIALYAAVAMHIRMHPEYKASFMDAAGIK